MAEFMGRRGEGACVCVYLLHALYMGHFGDPFSLLQIPIAYLHVMEIYKSDKFW